MKEIFRSKGLILFILVVILTGLISFRFLSDSDIGTHLKTGKWIIENNRIPDKDTFTYTCRDHEYLDSYWLFQVLVYSVYCLAGYNGLSIFVFLLSMLLIYLVMLRIRRANVPFFIAACVLLIGVLCIEPRITLRPEMFTFLFITEVLLILDRYYVEKRKTLYFLPLIMLLWCNMHGLFILGFLLMGAYLISIYFRDRKADFYFLFWTGIAFLVCFVNPYTYKLLQYSLFLNTRLNADNIFHQHIRELTSFNHLTSFLFKDYVFILLFSLIFIFGLISWRKRKIHEPILLIIFFYLAWASIRNIGLFTVIAIPILCISVEDNRKNWEFWIVKRIGAIRLTRVSTIIFILIVIFIIGTGVRIYTNSYYIDNNSYNKTGIGVDDRHLPVKAVSFLNENHLDGKIINSLSLGGWLAWSLPQPIFIDGRLEVIGDSLYNEVIASWSGGLGHLLQKYQPSMIIYNYDQYYPWTVQLSNMSNWRLIYLDGVAVIFAKSDYAGELPALDLSMIYKQFKTEQIKQEQENAYLNKAVSSSFIKWIQGFYKRPDYSISTLSKMASFCLLINNRQAARNLLVEHSYKSYGSSGYIYNALAEQKEKEAITSYNDGNLKVQNGDINGAISSYNKAIELNPYYFKAYNNRGILKASVLKNYQEALKDFDKAIEIKPDYADAYMGRGTCWFTLKETTKACNDWEKALSLGNNQVEKMIEMYCK